MDHNPFNNGYKATLRDDVVLLAIFYLEELEVRMAAHERIYYDEVRQLTGALRRILSVLPDVVPLDSITFKRD